MITFWQKTCMNSKSIIRNQIQWVVEASSKASKPRKCCAQIYILKYWNARSNYWFFAIRTKQASMYRFSFFRNKNMYINVYIYTLSWYKSERERAHPKAHTQQIELIWKKIRRNKISKYLQKVRNERCYVWACKRRKVLNTRLFTVAERILIFWARNFEIKWLNL